MRAFRYFLAVFFLVLAHLAFYSCVTPRQKVQPEEPAETLVSSRRIYFAGVRTADELAEFFTAHNPGYPHEDILALAELYVSEGAAEHINSDIAFVQMCLETGWQRYGNLVTPDMHNYCGLGAIDAAHPGERFETAELGVRAHIQHLHAYGTTADVSLRNECIDRRYTYVTPRGKAPTVFELSGTWAADRQYGEKLNRLLCELDER